MSHRTLPAREFTHNNEQRAKMRSVNKAYERILLRNTQKHTNGGDWTRDHTVKSRALYLLSYIGCTCYLHSASNIIMLSHCHDTHTNNTFNIAILTHHKLHIYYIILFHKVYTMHTIQHRKTKTKLNPGTGCCNRNFTIPSFLVEVYHHLYHSSIHPFISFFS